MSTVTAYFLIYNAVRKLQQCFHFPSYIVVINPWAENRSQNFLQNRNIPKENRESRHHDSNAFNALRVSHSIEINYVRHTSLPRFAKLSPEGWRSRIDRRAPSRIAPCKFNLRNKIARPRCLTKRNEKGGGGSTYLQVSTGAASEALRLCHSTQAPPHSFLDEPHVTRMRKSESTSCVLFLKFFFQFCVISSKYRHRGAKKDSCYLNIFIHEFSINKIYDFKDYFSFVFDSAI